MGVAYRRRNWLSLNTAKQGIWGSGVPETLQNKVFGELVFTKHCKTRHLGNWRSPNTAKKAFQKL
eukprot:6489072-Amphidinium_carterae.1